MLQNILHISPGLLVIVIISSEQFFYGSVDYLWIIYIVASELNFYLYLNLTLPLYYYSLDTFGFIITVKKCEKDWFAYSVREGNQQIEILLINIVVGWFCWNRCDAPSNINSFIKFKSCIMNVNYCYLQWQIKLFIGKVVNFYNATNLNKRNRGAFNQSHRLLIIIYNMYPGRVFYSQSHLIT